IRHAASVRPEPGSNSPIKFVSGSKLANHFMIDSSTLSLFSFQRASVFQSSSLRATFLLYFVTSVIARSFLKNFFNQYSVANK
ncbi:hypothetical protein, partial [Brevibacillus nitrificans]|uniref:hypothetical protein n=1 Tax=Brevibacillus nitrificans TaxID=651560 RepID=UPI001C82E888